jgi:oligosaccharide repeat unit polymerase
VLIIFMLLFFVFITGVIFKSFLNPMNMLYMMFLIMFGLLFIYFPNYILNFDSTLFLLCNISFFFLGSLFCLLIAFNRNVFRENLNFADIQELVIEKNKKRLKMIIYTFTILSSIGFLFFILSILSYFSPSQIFSNLNVIDTYSLKGEISAGFLGTRLIELSIPNMLLILLLSNSESLEFKKGKYKLMLAISILVNISVRRSSLIIILLVLTLFILYSLQIKNNYSLREILRENKDRFKKIVTVGIILLFFVFVFNFLQESLNKTKLFSSTGSSNFDSIILYIVGNIPSFETRYISSLLDPTYGAYTFRFIYQVLGLEVISDYGNEGYSILNIADTHFNTVPMNFYILRDFGIVGSNIFYFILGLITGVFYYKFKQNKNKTNIWWVIILSYLLILSIRSYELIFISFWWQLIVLLFISRWFNNKTILYFQKQKGGSFK